MTLSWSASPAAARVAWCVALSTATAPFRAAASTPISGPLPTHLTLAGSPYLVLGNLELRDGTSTADPGVELRFMGPYRLELRSSCTLTFIGTAEQPIVLHSASDTIVWGGIEDSGGPIAAVLQFEHVILEDAFQSIAIDSFQPDSRFTLRSCSVDASMGNLGIRIADPQTSGSVTTIFNVDVAHASGPGFLLEGRSDDVVNVANSAATQCRTGFVLQGDAVVASGLIAAQNLVGMEIFGGCSVSTSMMSDNRGDGVLVDLVPADTPAVFYGVTARDNDSSGVVIAPEGNVRCDSCTIGQNGLFDVLAESPVTRVPTLDFTRCQWDSATSAEMQAEGGWSDIASILDFQDGGPSLRSRVAYDDWITDAPPTTVLPVGARLSGYPNPFRSTVHLIYRSPQPRAGFLSIHDVAGRLVRRFEIFPSTSESVSVRWDGTTAAGTRAEPGVYFCRLRCEDGDAGTRIVLVK